MKFIFGKFTQTFIIFLFFAGLASAQTESEKGIKLYEAGNNKEAIAVLEKASKQIKNDAVIWNALGLAYIKDKNLKGAVKSFEKAVEFNQQNATYQTNLAYAYFLNGKLDKAQSAATKAIELNPKNVVAYYIRGSVNAWEGDNREALADADRALAANSDYALAYSLKADALHAAFGQRVSSGTKAIDALDLLEQAKSVLETCLKNCSNNPQKEIQEEKLEAIQIFYNYFSKQKGANLNLTDPALTAPDPSITPMKILSKAPARYTDKARESGIRGIIKMLVYFAESGRVTHTLILQGLGGGLNESAVNAARQIKFEPARKDGEPISQIKFVEYSFAF